MTTTMRPAYDVVVIGSGFGGAITACRLAQAGRSVCVLEKGKRWDRLDFPRGAGAVARSAIQPYDNRRAGQGFIEYRTFRNMDVIQGTGVGGGSLHYFNVHTRPPEFIFDQPAWPRRITLRRLRPYYALAANMLGANPITMDRQHNLPLRTQAFEDAVDSLGKHADRMDICVRLSDQTGIGPGQASSCEHCGNCMLGCHLHAKNTLDLNYIPLAEQHGAEVFPLHQALNIMPDERGFTVTAADLNTAPADQFASALRRIRARQVVVAAGTLGTNELLLRCKHHYKTLPRLSDKLGHRFSGNGDFLFAGIRYQSKIVEPGRGPGITAGVGFRKEPGQFIYIEDLGYPDPFIWYFNRGIPTRGRLVRLGRQARRYLGEVLGTGLKFELEQLLEAGYLTHYLPFLGMGTDAADGILGLNRAGDINLKWSVRKSLPMFRDMTAHMEALATASGGRFVNSFLWQTPLLRVPLRKTLTAHPLGGCAMSDTPATGVTNDCGEAWGYPGLFVADGALMPAAIGVNPSATISAIAERVAFQMIQGRELREGDNQAPVNHAVTGVPATAFTNATNRPATAGTT